MLVGTLGCVAAIVVTIVLVGAGGGTPAGGSSPQTAPSSVMRAVTNPDPAALASVAVAGASSPFMALPAGTPSLKAQGLPLVAYVGADYCPFCAARRWSVVVALSRFGGFSALGLTTSSSTDVFPDTASLSFHGSSYSSQYISFAGVETESRERQPLDTPSAQVADVLAHLDGPPYTRTAGAIPFLDIGGRWISIGGGYSPALLQGMSAQQIADVVRNPDSAVGRAIMADANIITAEVCSLTGGQPASVCAGAPVPAIAAALQGR